MTDLESLNSCPLCTSLSLHPWRPAPDRSYSSEDLGFQYSRCGRCDARFLDRRPTRATAGELYDELYEPYDVHGPNRPPPVEFTDPEPKATPWVAEVRAAYRVARPGARLLDVGCGSAYFLTAAQRAGWDPVGADFSPDVVQRVRAAGIEAHLIEALWPVVADRPVDLVRMNHVLEHLYDPIETLSSARSSLRPGGILHLAVPNPAGLASLLFRSHWMGLEPRHVILYTPDLLRSVLQQAGFTEMKVLHQPAGKDVRRSAEYAARGHRLPGRALRILSSRHAERGYATLCAAAARLGRGDRLHVLAVR